MTSERGKNNKVVNNNKVTHVHTTLWRHLYSYNGTEGGRMKCIFVLHNKNWSNNHLTSSIWSMQNEQLLCYVASETVIGS